MQDGAGREQRLFVVGVEIDEVPRELVLADAAQRFDLVAAGVDGLHARSFPAVVHMRLEGQHAGRFGQGVVSVEAHVVGVGRNVEILRVADFFGGLGKLGRVPLGIELQGESDVGGRLLAHRDGDGD